MTKVTLTEDKAIMSLRDYLDAYFVVSQMRQFWEDNYNIGDYEFQAGIFKEAVIYLCNSFPCNLQSGEGIDYD